MGKAKPIEIITPPNVLKAKLGGPLSLNSSDAIKLAEKALESLSGEFEDWLNEEITRVETAWKNAKPLTDRDAQLSEVFGMSHDLKGLATTYGYPLITRYADSLCKLLATEECREIAPVNLIDAHIKACRTAMRDEIKAENHPLGVALATELETQTGKMIAGLDTD
ncbi:Hpt domain-containing protein [Ponticaulis sp.]|uniref:Hpt domain-containing protein n=1 Tax=Ponticaulis sp. TaxID=2020902 RepID=UPI000B6F34C6|nr:Hpt domain-containing protein [Ponticaulis sp.]MAI91934.1 hypothetical protein [Ponticaulis sp.]OUX96471.1 MAG: hypothetical protein CBB65_16005 [Hyphomonadaceae bacterium TMED5]|tara:strand:- start:11747 stop:12244 length:498 start_codon:yes stop_codon:yes gene_type:complete